MSEVRVVDLKELGVNKEVFDKIYSMGEQDGRSDKFQEITSEYMLLTEKQVEEIRTDERIKTIDECITTLKNSIPYTNSDDIICGFSCAKQRLEQLKGTE